MNLNHTIIIILGAAQLIAAQNLEDSNSSILITTPELLSRYFNMEYRLLASDIARKYKNMSDHILNDTMILQMETPLIQQLKRNISSLEEMYKIYEKFNLFKKALVRYSDMFSPLYNRKLDNETANNNDAQYISDLLKKLNYENITREFELKFVNLMTDKFLRKLKELESFILSNQTQNLQEFLKWSRDIKKCSEYNCFRRQIVNLDKVASSPKNRFFAYVNYQLENLNIFYVSRILGVVKNVIEDPKIDELSQDTKADLLQKITNFIRNYEQSKNFQEFVDTLPSFYQNVISQYYEKAHFKEHELLKIIFDEAGYAQFRIDYSKKFRNFLDQGIVKEFENYRASATEDELLREIELTNWYERFKSLTTIKEKNKAFDELFEIMERN